MGDKRTDVRRCPPGGPPPAQLLDEAPDDAGELVDYFARLSPRQVASCAPGVIVDAIDRELWSLPELCRVLVAAMERASDLPRLAQHGAARA